MPSGVLLLEDVRQATIVGLGPEIALVRYLDQLRRDSDSISGAAYASLQDELHPQLAADLLDALPRLLVAEGRGACDDAAPNRLEAARVRDQLVRHSVDEVFLLRIRTQIFQRENREHDAAGTAQPG